MSRCQHVDISHLDFKCPNPGHEVRLKCPAGRPDAVGCYCDEHGGAERARQLASQEWNYLAPECVGDEHAVEDAGCQCLGTPEAYVVIRQTPAAQGGTWLAWLGLGSRLKAVPSEAGPRLDVDGKPRLRRGKPFGAMAFSSRNAAVERALSVWRKDLARRVAEIRRARGGTLSWGTPIEPLANPIVILLEQGDSRSAWDVAVRLPRKSPEGVASLTGLRPSGETF